jgi:hypothetical protein
MNELADFEAETQRALAELNLSLFYSIDSPTRAPVSPSSKASNNDLSRDRSLADTANLPIPSLSPSRNHHHHHLDRNSSSRSPMHSGYKDNQDMSLWFGIGEPVEDMLAFLSAPNAPSGRSSH